ncbi:MAG: hypothetical protein JW390_30177 [Nitrosopumilus sp.]|nr:hypothetical protein [Candidatus Nitrosopumilus limneticus]
MWFYCFVDFASYTLGVCCSPLFTEVWHDREFKKMFLMGRVNLDQFLSKFS